MSDQLSRVAFLGIGLMGKPMAMHLVQSGFSLNVWNRTAAKLQPLVAAGAIGCSTAAEAVNHADIIITMLETGEVVEHVLFNAEVLAALKPGALVIDMSSIPPESARKHAAKLADQGVFHLDAPVSGGTVGAEQATLSVMVGGEKAQCERAMPIFNRMAKSVTYIGPSGSGQLAKCANQAIVGITIGAVAEALSLAAAGGADPVAVREALLGGFAQSRILDLHGQRMLERAFQPGATSRVQLKDLKTILDSARSEGLTLPLTQRVYEMYQSMVSRGLEEVDHSGLLLELEAVNYPFRLSSGDTDAPNAEVLR